MLRFTTITSLALCLITYATAQDVTWLHKLAPRQTDSNCSDIHFIIARGSLQSQTDGAPPGAGPMGAVAVDVCAQHPNCTAYGLVYPATLQDYVSSEAQGTAAMQLAVQQYYTSCPKTPIVLMGYSQGAHVVGDVICGTSESGWPVTSPLNGSIIKNILAIIQMGDPTYVPNLPWNIGTATTAGYFPRQNTSACSAFASRIQSYCDDNDKYCASGDSIPIHAGYVSEYGAVAVEYVIGKFKAWSASVSASSGAATATATATGKTSGVTGTKTASATATATSGAGAVVRPVGSDAWSRLGYAVVATSVIGAAVFGGLFWRARLVRRRDHGALELR